MNFGLVVWRYCTFDERRVLIKGGPSVLNCLGEPVTAHVAQRTVRIVGGNVRVQGYCLDQQQRVAKNSVE